LNKKSVMTLMHTHTEIECEQQRGGGGERARDGDGGGGKRLTVKKSVYELIIRPAHRCQQFNGKPMRHFFSASSPPKKKNLPFLFRSLVARHRSTLSARRRRVYSIVYTLYYTIYASHSSSAAPMVSQVIDEGPESSIHVNRNPSAQTRFTPASIYI
jgi:hypothetical protein